MRTFVLVLSFFIIHSTSASTESNYFEKRFQEMGKKIDEAKAKGQELGADAKRELKELKAASEEATEKAAEESKEAGQDWKQRFKSAFQEVGAGMKSAWKKLKGEP